MKKGKDRCTYCNKAVSEKERAEQRHPPFICGVCADFSVEQLKRKMKA